MEYYCVIFIYCLASFSLQLAIFNFELMFCFVIFSYYFCSFKFLAKVLLNSPKVLLLIACVLLIFVWVQLVLASLAQFQLFLQSVGSQLNSARTFRLNVAHLFLSDQQHAEGQEAAEVRTVKPWRRAAVLQHQIC